MVKLNASKQPKQGTILLNPGGPGQSGREFLAGEFGAALQVVTGGFYDLISFDPRATLAKSCEINAGAIGELLGTGYVARDMIQIVDALDDEDGLLNYWGFSYGSALGATVAAMFPTRMGKVVLDGVLNPIDYFSRRDVSQLTATDVSFHSFVTGYMANPEMCVLAQLARDAEQLEQKVYSLIYSLKYDPFVTGYDITSDIIDYTVIKNAIQSALLNPSTWSLLAAGLYGLLTENVTEARTIFSLGVPPPPIFRNNNNGQDAAAGIRFSDVSLERRNTTSFPQLLEGFYATSRLLGDSLSSLALSYQDWPFKAKGAYTGDFRVKTKNPMLLIGSPYDPVTPLANAINASAGFEGSVVLEHGGYGHTSPAQPSLCTARAIRTYFVNGTLPAMGTRCEPVFGLFSNQTIAEALALLEKRSLEDDGASLMAAMMQLSTR
ncbi:MAG: hypothetical protein Q9207_005717, partial [Kuettlingeria erythrocarpa]